MFMSYNSNTMGAIKEQKLLTLPELMSLSAIVGGWWFMVLNAIFNHISIISWQTALLVEETRVSGENHRPVASN